MAKDPRKALDDKTAKLSRGGQIKTGKEHEAYQGSQQQLLAIQAEQKQNLAVARAESKASFENNQTLMQAAELGAISAAEAEQSALSGDIGGQQLNPATQAVLAKYGMGQPKFVKTQSHSQQVTKQNITINNNTNVSTTNDVKVPANIGGPLQGRPLQFKSPASKGDSTGKFKAWISSAFARQNEEGAKRDREYRNRESSLTRSANKMMKKLEDIGKTIGSRMDPRKIGSTWQSQLKTLLFLFGFGYLTSNWTKILGKVAGIESWVKKTWEYFTKGGFSSSVSELFGGKPGQPIFDSLKTLFLGNEEEKGLFGHIKQFFQDMWDERAEAVKLVKAPDIDLADAINNPLNAVKSLFEYLSNILTAAFSGAEGIKKIRLEEVNAEVTRKSDEYRIKNSTTDNYSKRKVNGEDQDVEWGTSAYLDIGHKGYKGASHHMLEGGELTSKFGAESSVAQMSELSRVMDDVKNSGKWDTDTISHALSRLSKFAGKQGMIPLKKSHLSSMLSSDEINKLISSGDLIRNVPYREVIRPKTDDDYARNLYGNDYLDPKSAALASYVLNTEGAEATGSWWGKLRSWGTRMKATKDITGMDGMYAGTAEFFTGLAGTAHGAGRVARAVDQRIKEGKAGYRTEYVRADSPERPGDIATGNTVYFDEISKNGIQALAKGILSNNGSDVEDVRVDPEDIVRYTELLRGAAHNPVKDREQIEKKRKEIEDEIKRLSGSGTDLVGYDLSRPTEDQGSKFRFEQPVVHEWGMDPNKGVEEATQEKIRQLQQQLKALNGKLIMSSEVESGLKDYNELDARNRERDKKRQEDWENSAAGRMVENYNDKLYNISDGILGSQKLTVDAKDRSKYAMKRFMEEGLTKEQAAGIVGNMLKESGLKPDVKIRDSNGKYAGGLVGWNGDNLAAVEKYFSRDIRQVSFEEQLEYLIKELKGEAGVIRAVERNGFLKKHGFKKGANVMDVMKTTTSLQDATDTFERIFEGSGDYAGYTDTNGVRHEGDKNRRRHDYAATVYKNSGGDLSNIKFVEYEGSGQVGNEKEEHTEEKSFLEILKDKVTQLITSFGTAFSGTIDKVQEVQNSINGVIKKTFITDGAYEGPITKEFLNYDDYLKDHGTLPAGLNFSQWKNKVYDTTGEFPDKLELRGDTKEILSKYEKGKEIQNTNSTKLDETKVETSNTDTNTVGTGIITDIAKSAIEKNKGPLGEVTSILQSIDNKLGSANDIAMLNTAATGHVVDAVNNGTRSSTNSSRQMISAMNAANQNNIEQSNSLVKDKINTEGVLG